MLALLVLLSAAVDTSGYWQQEVRYEIAARLDETTGVLAGTARITYRNNSPDTLREFYLHQFLNAFRPGSRWAKSDQQEGRVRFQRLEDPDYGFSRITRAEVMGRAGGPEYPFAPDSTVARLPLPSPLSPGDSMMVIVEWTARPSTLPRRQGRDPATRRYDFAQWYPKVVVYDRYGWNARPLYPAGEFYGEFATYDVMLDLPEDQVIGATGVPVEGDPGWERAKANPGVAVDHQRDWYGPGAGSREPGAACSPGPGRKCVRFVAKQVHDFAFSLNPRYRYEEGRYGNVVVRVLYQPGDERTWGGGIAVQRTETALAWLDSLYGPFPWPQLTNVHRIENGGTEYPMMVMDGGPSLGLILHEVGHNYTMGVLANNEWREGWLDEGFTSFQSAWYFETHGGQPAYPGLEPFILDLDLSGWSQPVSMRSEHFRDFTTYNLMIYSKAQLFYEQLRYVVGHDVMRRILRTYYSRWKLRHVSEDAFREVAEEVSGQDLKWLFAQWLHGTPLIDYRLKRVGRERLDDGRWRVRATVERLGDGRMPIEIGEVNSSRVFAHASGEPEEETVEFVTEARPGRLLLDPRVRTHDWNFLNNAERGFWARGRAPEIGLDRPWRDDARRDRTVVGLLPVAWYTDHGGVTLALRSRANYLGRFNRELSLLSVPLRSQARDEFPKWVGAYYRVTDPVTPAAAELARRRVSVTGSAWWLEGRTGGEVEVRRSLRRHLSFGDDWTVGSTARWMATPNLEYVDRTLWDDAGTIEVGPWVEGTIGRGRATLRGRAHANAGLLYWRPGPGITTATRYDAALFFRPTIWAGLEVPAPAGTVLRVRGFAGAYLSDTTGGGAGARQRRIPVAGADPYETFTNPLLRSRGAILARDGVHYHAPGNGNLRAFAGGLGGRWALTLNLELHWSVYTSRRGFLRAVAVMGFADGGLVDSLAVPSFDGLHAYTTLYDGGVGIVSRHQLGDRAFVLRLEAPLVVNRWTFARDFTPGDGRLAFRWQMSLESSW